MLKLRLQEDSELIDGFRCSSIEYRDQSIKRKDSTHNSNGVFFIFHKLQACITKESVGL